jgi:uridine kinase
MNAETIHLLAYLELLRIGFEMTPETMDPVLEDWVENYTAVRNKSIELTNIYNDIIVALQEKDFDQVSQLLVEIDSLATRE